MWTSRGRQSNDRVSVRAVIARPRLTEPASGGTLVASSCETVTVGDKLSSETRMIQQSDILLVEDDASHVKLVEAAFRRHDGHFQITVVNTIAAAHEKIADGGWELVLADYLLGEDHGTDLIPDDAESAEYGVVLLTSHGDEHIAVNALKSGAVDYVVKSPESFIALPRLCERAIQNRQLVQQRREAEQALRLSEQRLALSASGSAAWDFDPATGRMTWSSEAAQLADLPAGTHDNAIQDYIQRVHSDDRPAVQTAWQSLVEMPVAFNDPVRVEHRITLRDGSTRWIELSGRRMESGTNAPFQLSGMLTNISARKRADEELELKQQELAHVARLATLGELIAGISHELNQPLSAISNFAAAGNRLLEDEAADVTQLREWHTGIGRAAGLAGGIIRRLRGLVDRRPGKRVRVNVFDLIAPTRGILQSEERARRVTVTVGHGTDNPEVEVDSVQIQQVLMNLLHNAYEAVLVNPVADRRVEIDVASNADTLRVTISDSGAGLQIDEPHRVFESFYTTRENGLGMGLAISRSIIQAHGGQLGVESLPGKGASFRFDLPQPASPADLEKHDGEPGSVVPSSHLDAAAIARES